LTVVDGRVQAVTLFQSVPRFGKTHEDLPALAKSLGLGPSDIAAEILPVQVVSTGAGHLMVPVRSAGALERITPSADLLLAQLRSVEAEGCYAFCSEPRSTAPPTYRARFFNPGYGLWEDPATGTAAGPLVCHLVAHGRVAAGAKVHVEQGHALRRPSVLEVAYDGERVTVSGGAVVVARGELTI
jgi:trans-2,3-dihydro-3-hydroxyanthranilate isomerase